MNDTIPAITLHQPWASLIACGAKTFETRSWKTPHRGQIAIHAAKSIPDYGQELIEELVDAEKTPDGWAYSDFMTATALAKIGIHRPDQFPLGAIVCLADLTDCIPTQQAPHEMRRFGDFTPGRWAWRLESIHVMDPPFPCRGYQGVWRWDPVTKQSIAPDFTRRAA